MPIGYPIRYNILINFQTCLLLSYTTKWGMILQSFGTATQLLDPHIISRPYWVYLWSWISLGISFNEHYLIIITVLTNFDKYAIVGCCFCCIINLSNVSCGSTKAPRIAMQNYKSIKHYIPHWCFEYRVKELMSLIPLVQATHKFHGLSPMSIQRS